MTGKILILVPMIIFLLFLPAHAENTDFSYDDFIKESNKYKSEEYNFDIENAEYTDVMSKLGDVLLNGAVSQVKELVISFSFIITICIVSSLLKTMVTSDSVGEVSSFGCYMICVFILAYQFKTVSDIGISAIRDLCNYMNIAVPGYATLLAASGYAGTATAMHAIFVFAANVIASLLDKFVVPVVFSCGILTLSNGVCNLPEIDNLIKQIIKMSKYIIGFMLTIFSAIISFAGLNASTGDGLMVKTAKYAVSNFVPIVGGCLADTLNSVVYTSLIMKNTVGFIGIITIAIICLLPIVKVFAVSFLIRIFSYFVSMLQHVNLSKMLETLSEIVSFVGALLVFITVVFVLLTGVIASIGV